MELCSALRIRDLERGRYVGRNWSGNRQVCGRCIAANRIGLGRIVFLEFVAAQSSRSERPIRNSRKSDEEQPTLAWPEE
jgi:hypothetical protein